MKYLVLKPPVAFDPRNRTFANLECLLELVPKVSTCDFEGDAADEVRELYPDALAMPTPVKIGSGTSWMLGIIASVDTPRDPDAEIPFVCFVMAQAETDRERKKLATPKHWTQSLWKPQVVRPTGSITTPIEIRATDLPQPSMLDAKIGKTADGRTVLYATLGGIELSITFRDPDVAITAKSPEPYPENVDGQADKGWTDG